MKLGIVGLGRMGSAMALRLMEEGNEVRVWNRSREKLAPVVAAGAREASSPAALAGEVDAVLSMLTDAAGLAKIRCTCSTRRLITPSRYYT